MVKVFVVLLVVFLCACSKENQFVQSPQIQTAANLESCDYLKATVDSFEINGGAEQRSQVTDLEINFDRILPFSTTEKPPIRIVPQKGGSDVIFTSTIADSSGKTKVALHFKLEDGIYDLKVALSSLRPCDGASAYDILLAGDLNSFSLFRLFGDMNGDGSVSANDFNLFRLSFGGSNPALDYDGDGAVAANDFNQFRLRFGGNLF